MLRSDKNNEWMEQGLLQYCTVILIIQGVTKLRSQPNVFFCQVNVYIVSTLTAYKKRYFSC